MYEMPDLKKCKKFKEILKLLILSDPNYYQDYKGQVHCFKKILMGTGSLGHHDPKQNPQLYISKQVVNGFRTKQMIDYILKINNFTPQMKKSNIHIGIVVKRGCRTIDNYDVVIEGLKKNYSHLEVNAVYWEKYGIFDQIDLAQNIDILITPVGAASYFSLFMKKGSHIIVFPICHSVCNNQEGFYFSTIPHLNYLYYYVDVIKELMPAPPPGCNYNHRNIIVNVERLSNLIDYSINQIEFNKNF